MGGVSVFCACFVGAFLRFGMGSSECLQYGREVKMAIVL